MHIAFLTPEYPHSLSKSSGGLGTSIKNLAEGLVENDQKVSVIVYGQDENAIVFENGIQFYFIKQKKYVFGGWFLYRKHLQKLLNKLIKTENIDIVEAPDWTGITAFMQLNCPLVIRLNGSDGYFCALEGRKQKFKNRIFEKTALRHTNALASVSKFTAEKTNEVFGLNKTFTIIPNSIQAENFKPIPDKVISNQILYFGTIIRKKGILELAFIFNEVYKQNPQAELVLIGKDVVDIFENCSTLEIFKENLDVIAQSNVTWKTEVDYSEIQQYIAAAQVIVLPSFAEALPMTWLEAMAMEKALVTSNIGWANEVMLDGETGFSVDPKDHKTFARCILELLENPDLGRKMGKNARNKVKAGFSSKIVAKKNMEFYRRQI